MYMYVPLASGTYSMGLNRKKPPTFRTKKVSFCVRKCIFFKFTSCTHFITILHNFCAKILHFLCSIPDSSINPIVLPILHNATA